MVEHYLKGAKWVLENSTFKYEGVLDANGQANLKNVALGEYDFTVSKTGYKTSTKKVNIGSTFNLDVKLEKAPAKKSKPKSTKSSNSKASSKKSVDKKTDKESTEPKSKKTTKKSTKKSTKKTNKSEDKKSENQDK